MISFVSILYSTWAFGGGGLCGPQLFQGYCSSYVGLRTYQPSRGFLWEFRAGALWFIAGKLVGGEFFPLLLAGSGPTTLIDLAEENDKYGKGILLQFSGGYRFVDPRKRSCLLGLWDLFSRKSNESNALCCLGLGRFGPPDILLGVSWSRVFIEDPQAGGSTDFYWTSAWAAQLVLSYPLVIRGREVGDVYWMGLAGNISDEGFSLMTPLAGGLNLWLFNWGAKSPDQQGQEKDHQEVQP